jgi:hypothetical protein
MVCFYTSFLLHTCLMHSQLDPQSSPFLFYSHHTTVLCPGFTRRRLDFVYVGHASQDDPCPRPPKWYVRMYCIQKRSPRAHCFANPRCFVCMLLWIFRGMAGLQGEVGHQVPSHLRIQIHKVTYQALSHFLSVRTTISNLMPSPPFSKGRNLDYASSTSCGITTGTTWKRHSVRWDNKDWHHSSETYPLFFLSCHA